MKIKHIYDPIFRQNYYYVKSKSHKEFVKVIKKELNVDIDEKKSTDGGFFVFECMENKICVLWAKNGEQDLIVHEIMHAVSFVLREKGISLSDETDEIFAYLMQFLFKEING